MYRRPIAAPPDDAPQDAKVPAKHETGLHTKPRVAGGTNHSPTLNEHPSVRTDPDRLLKRYPQLADYSPNNASSRSSFAANASTKRHHHFPGSVPSSGPARSQGSRSDPVSASRSSASPPPPNCRCLLGSQVHWCSACRRRFSTPAMSSGVTSTNWCVSTWAHAPESPLSRLRVRACRPCHAGRSRALS